MGRGRYRAVDELLEQAVRLLHEQGDRPTSHRATIAQLVEADWEAAVRGELEIHERNLIWHNHGSGYNHQRALRILVQRLL